MGLPFNYPNALTLGVIITHLNAYSPYQYTPTTTDTKYY